ncbi:MAG: hypothetical protein GYB24_15700 [Rhodobacteraceae bacterium]|nr:hypothetical protein [Paracoccaceae bacterium]
MNTLGLFEDVAEQRLVATVKKAIATGEHPHSAALGLRSSGEILALPARKALGISGRLKISREAFDMLSEKGRLDPKAAFDETLTRAILSKLRSDRIEADVAQGVREWTALMPFWDRCSGCKQWRDKAFRYEQVNVLGPENCFRAACASSFTGRWQSMVLD